MKPAISNLDERAFHFISAHYETEGVVPTQRELLRALGLSQESYKVAQHIFLRLTQAGLLRRNGHFSRGYELVKTEYQYPADCSCGVCANARHFAQLQLVEGLHVPPPDALIPKLTGLKPLSTYTKGYWLLGFPARPERSAAQ